MNRTKYVFCSNPRSWRRFDLRAALGRQENRWFNSRNGRRGWQSRYCSDVVLMLVGE